LLAHPLKHLFPLFLSRSKNSGCKFSFIFGVSFQKKINLIRIHNHISRQKTKYMRYLHFYSTS
jgi:hypothetical protein